MGRQDGILMAKFNSWTSQRTLSCKTIMIAVVNTNSLTATDLEQWHAKSDLWYLFVKVNYCCRCCLCGGICPFNRLWFIYLTCFRFSFEIRMLLSTGKIKNHSIYSIYSRVVPGAHVLFILFLSLLIYILLTNRASFALNENVKYRCRWARLNEWTYCE